MNDEPAPASSAGVEELRERLAALRRSGRPSRPDAARAYEAAEEALELAVHASQQAAVAQARAGQAKLRADEAMDSADASDVTAGDAPPAENPATSGTEKPR